MKVAIFNGYGESGFPDYIEEQIVEKSFPEYRCGSIINILESYPNEPNMDKYKNLKVGEVLRYGDIFYFGNSFHPVRCTIEEVDISKKWTIEEYDGVEGIEYLEFECLSEELNYYKQIHYYS